tara:strand:+ start:365 stop:895 length:531 start_codon:yes stop_codon:yes gene_type:complete
MKDNYDLSKLSSPKKKRINSKAKGSTFERNIAKMLNERFNTKEFARSPGSGAFATTHTLPEHLKLYGDLIAPLGFGFVLECKAGYDKENLGGFFTKNSGIKKFIEQANTDAVKAKKDFMVVFKQSRKDILCILDYSKTVLDKLNSSSTEYLLISNKYLCLRFEDLLLFSDSFFFTE